MKSKKAIVLVSVALAASLTAGIGTAAYAYYVRHELNKHNTLNIGNAEMSLTDENGGSDKAFFNADILPYDGKFMPQSYEDAVAAAEADNGISIAHAKITVSRDIATPVFYGLCLSDDGYENNVQLLKNTYVTAYVLSGTDEAVTGNLTEWSHSSFEEAGYIEDKMGASSVTYHLFITYESINGAGIGGIQFDVSLEAGPAPVGTEYDIKAGENSDITLEGVSGISTVVADVWYDGAAGKYSVTQNGENLFSNDTPVGGWEQVKIPGVLFDESGKATLGLSCDNGSLYIKNIQKVEVESITLDTSSVQKVFAAGQQFNSNGLKVTANYNDGSSVVLESGFEVVADITETGVKQAVVSYEGKTAEYQIAVVPHEEDNSIIEFASKDEQASLTLYITELTGGGANTENADVKGVYLYRDENGFSMFDFDYSYAAQSWSSSFNSVGVFENVFNDMWSENNGSLFVELGDEEKAFETMRFSVSANEWHTKVMGWVETAEISDVTIPEETEFVAGGRFDGTGTIINYKMTDGSTGALTVSEEDISVGKVQFYDKSQKVKLDNEYVLEEGELEIRVMYDSKVYDIKINVVADSINGVEVDTSSMKTSFMHGEAFSYEGIKVIYIYNSGKTEPVEDEAEIIVTAPENFETAIGEQQVNVAVGEYQTSYAINVEHSYSSSEFVTEESAFYRICGCGHREKVDVYTDRVIIVNGTTINPIDAYKAENVGYGITYDVTKGNMDAEFVITLTTENTGEGGIYANGLNIVAKNNNVVIVVNEDVTLGTFNASAEADMYAKPSVTICGEGKLSVTTDFASSVENLVVLSDVSVSCTFKVGRMTFGSEGNSCAPVLDVYVNGDVNGVETKDVGGMDWKVYSGKITIHNEKQAYCGISFNTAADRLYIGKNAEMHIVNFGAGYAAWDSAIGNYYISVYGSLNVYGASQDNPNINAVEALSPEQVGTYVSEGATYNANLPLDNWLPTVG